MRLRGVFSAAALLALGACTGDFPNLRSTSILTIRVVKGDTGTPDQRLPIVFRDPYHLTVRVEAHRPDGSIDDSFNGFVRVSVKPGTVLALNGPGANRRNVQLKAGVADGIDTSLVAAYGDTRLWVEDVGFVPANPTAPDKPKCSNGLDDDGDGLIDYPADPGCAFANDDTEEDGTYSAGVSAPIYFSLPRVADVRGVNQGGGTPFPKEQVFVDTGYRAEKNLFAFSTVVTRIAADGFYVTDIDDPRGYSSVYAFTFNAPPRIGVCDRLTTLSGTSSDFFGFTELGFPTWSIEPWDGNPDHCRVPEPYAFTASDVADAPTKGKFQSALVRLLTTPPEGTPRTDPFDKTRQDTVFAKIHVGSHFGQANPGQDLLPTETASNCDFNGDGKVDFTTDPEKTCSDNCTKDVECTEYSNFAARSSFSLVIEDTNPKAPAAPAKIFGDASTVSTFDPLAMKGKPLKSFSGTLRYFSGGAQFTIEARCPDDIVTDLTKQPMPANAACVFRNGSNNNTAN